jgi:hypothetical protein
MRDAGQIIEAIPARSGRPGCVVFGGLGNEVLGLDGATGEERWRGQGRGNAGGAVVNGSPIFTGLILHDDREGALPRVLGRTDSATTCSLTLPVAGDETIRREPARLSPREPDPRLFRPLPWAEWSGEAVGVMAYMAGLATTLIVLPVSALRWIAKRRPVKLGRLMLVPAVLGLTLAAARAWQMTEWGPSTPGAGLELTFLEATLGLPTAVLPAMLGLWAIRGRWRTLALAVALIAASAACGMAFTLYANPQGLAPWQSYSWEGWYWIAAPAAYAAGGVLALGVALIWIGRGLRRLAGRATRRPRAA